MRANNPVRPWLIVTALGLVSVLPAGAQNCRACVTVTQRCPPLCGDEQQPG
jgi:hypothetical protein